MLYRVGKWNILSCAIGKLASSFSKTVTQACTCAQHQPVHWAHPWPFPWQQSLQGQLSVICMQEKQKTFMIQFHPFKHLLKLTQAIKTDGSVGGCRTLHASCCVHMCKSSIAQLSMPHDNRAQHGTTRHNTAQHNTAHHKMAVQHCTTWHVKIHLAK